MASVKKKLSNAGTHLKEFISHLTHHATVEATDGPVNGEESAGSHSAKEEYHPHSVKEMLSTLQQPGFSVLEMQTNGRTPLHYIVTKQYKKKERHLKVKLLLTLLTYSDIDVNHPDEDGNTALHEAVKVGDLKVIRLLLAFGARINILNSHNRSPLDLVEGPYRFQDVSSGFLMVDVDQVDADPSTLKQPSNVDSHESYYNLHHSFTSHFAKNGNVQELVCFLKGCGAERSRNVARTLNPVAQFQDFVHEEKLDPEFPSVTEKQMKLRPVEWGKQLPVLFHQVSSEIDSKLSNVGYSLSKNPDEAMALGIQLKELRMLKEAGSRILFLDGGGIRGLLQIEILSQLEEQTGRRITELFDWIVGTSTGGVIALGLVYGKKTLRELRQLYHIMKDDVFGKNRLGMGYNSKALESLLRKEFGGIRMDEVKCPRVLITAVHKKTINLKLRFFNNCFEDEFSKHEVWRVARYTSAAPMFFNELDDYVDGGVLANNPSASGLSKIQDFYRSKGERLPISLVVSVGSGKLPDEQLGRIDAQDFLFFGKHWFNFRDRLKDRVGNLATLLGNAVVESEYIAENVRIRCQEQNIDYYRFNPQLQEVIPSGETDLDKLIDMVLLTRTCLKTQCSFHKLVLRFHQCSKANKKMSTRYCQRQCTAGRQL